MNDKTLRYYRAYSECIELLNKDKNHVGFVNHLTKDSSPIDKLDAVHYWCKIETDWIDFIEAGLPYIEKSISEERQFILHEGNVVPIENVKKVSRDSITHLSKHGEFISTIQEYDSIIPDKLYVKENQNNYQVYENRFLYMVLCYLRDFVDIRYNKIVESNNTYYSDLSLEKKTKQDKREIVFKLDFSERKYDDENYDIAPEQKEAIKRIESIRFYVSALIRTELMKEVSKAPPLRPPVTQTNVLKMDINFKEVFKLYESLISYTEDGYSIEQKKLVLSPLSAPVSKSFSELIALNSFLAYYHGNGLEELLENEYKKEKLNEINSEQLKQRDRLAEIKRKITDGNNIEEYIVELEDYSKKLEVSSENNLILADENDELRNTNKALLNEQSNLIEQLSKVQKEFRKQNEEFAFSFEKQKNDHQKQMDELSSRFESEKNAAKNTFDNELGKLNEELEKANEKIVLLEEANSLLSARLHATLKELGRSEDEDYSSETDFKKLEKELKAYEKFFEKHWQKAKKGIRKEYLWNKKV